MSDGDKIDVTPNKDGGVLKAIVTPGSGDAHPSNGDTVFVHYTGTLASNGAKFDSSRDRNEPFKFTLGKGQVIKAWDLGVASMKKGEVANLECRADYAYGDTGSPPKIPGGATLNFNVELIRWEGEDISPDRDGTITKSIIVEGEKYNCPTENALVKVHIVGFHEGRQFYDQDFDYTLGEGELKNLPEGVDRAIRRINKGEKCRVTIKSRFGYGSSPPAEFNLPPNANLTFTIFLKDFEKAKASWELTDEEKIETANKSKERGTEFLNEGKLRLAFNKYSYMLTLLEYGKPMDEKWKEDWETTLIAGFLNCALVNLKQNETAECIKYCDKALEKRPDHVKALYRKGQALQQRKDYEDAIEVYTKVTEKDPANKAAQQQILVCKQKIAELRSKEKKRFAGMFDKLAREVEKERMDVDEAARQNAFPEAEPPKAESSVESVA